MECQNWERNLERNWKLKNRAKGIKFATRRLENSIKSAQNLLQSALMVLKTIESLLNFLSKNSLPPSWYFRGGGGGGGGVLILSFGL